MAVAAASFHDSLNRRAGERRLSIALGVSLLVHAIAIGLVRAALPVIHTYSQGDAANLPVLRAVLAGPKSESQPEPAPAELAIDTSFLLPPAAYPLELPIERLKPETAPVLGEGSTRSGTAHPDISISVGLIDDPARLGPIYVPMLAQRFPQKISKAPQLFGTPIVMYPPEAIAAGAQQRIAALVTLDTSGRIVESELVPNDPLFGPVVLEALKSAQFTAAEIDSAPVPYFAIVEFVFMLERPSAPPPSAKPARVGTLFRQPSVGK